MNTATKVQNIVHFKQTFVRIVEHIVQHRKQANLTQSQLAEILKIDRRKIIALEAGKIDLNTMLLASDILGININFNFEIE